MTEEVQEKLIKLKYDSIYKKVLEFVSLQKFWCKKAVSFAKIWGVALRHLVLFSMTYLFSKGFYALLVIKKVSRNRLKARGGGCEVLNNNIRPRFLQFAKNYIKDWLN